MWFLGCQLSAFSSQLSVETRCIASLLSSLFSLSLSLFSFSLLFYIETRSIASLLFFFSLLSVLYGDAEHRVCTLFCSFLAVPFFGIWCLNFWCFSPERGVSSLCSIS